MKRLPIFLLFSLLLLNQRAMQAQQISRSGYVSQLEAREVQRQFPCGGQVLSETDFESDALPAGWQSIDLDGLAVNPNIDTLVGPGWQPFSDPKGNGNRLLVSPSWYDSAGTSDDWLISPAITLSDNVCLSWYAYSVDRFYPESYEVRISTTEAIPDSFLTQDPLVSVEAEAFSLNYRSVNLAAYAGQTVYIAFRHTSEDKFMLALDEIRFSQVLPVDLAMFDAKRLTGGEADISYRIQGAVLNVGSDTLRLDSTLQINYSVDGGEVFSTTLDTLIIVPNDTANFKHSIFWRPETDAVYQICLWLDGIDDANPSNDTLCYFVGIGIFTSDAPQLEASQLEAYPNPFSEHITLSAKELPNFTEGAVYLYNAWGQAVTGPFSWQGQTPLRFSTANLPQGLYVLAIRQADQLLWHKKLIKR